MQLILLCLAVMCSLHVLMTSKQYCQIEKRKGNAATLNDTNAMLSD